MDMDEILELNLNSLREKLTALGLSTRGRKRDLQDALLEHFGHSRDVGVDVSSDSDEGNGHRSANVQMPVQNSFSLRDIEDTLSSFSGCGQPDVNQWLQEFEDNAAVVNWNELQKFIYGKQLLRGAARIFVRSQRAVRDWNSLKSILKKEFGVKLSANEIHRRLKNRRKRINETSLEYLYSLMEIASQINMDDESIIEYFIDGIPDTRANKQILYQALNLEDLKENLRIYEKCRGPQHNMGNRPFIPQSSQNKGNTKNEVQSSRACFQCGKLGHLARQCNQSAIRCFKCNQVGHKANECKQMIPRVEGNNENKRVNVVTDGEEEPKARSTLKDACLFRELQINGYTFSALLDTGSDICVIRYDTLLNIGYVDLQPITKALYGIGNKMIQTIGCFTALMDLDGVEVNIEFHVAKERDILYDAILGKDILRQVDVVIDSEGVKFQKKRIAEQKPEPKEVSGKIVASEDAKRIDELAKEFGQILYSVSCESAESQVELVHLPTATKESVLSLITNYRSEKKMPSPIEMKIILSDEVPVYQRPRRMSYADQCLVENQVEEWLADNIIQVSTSEYASPIVLVTKKDGTKRLCCDYRKLNEKIIRDNFPMPLIDNILQRLQSATFYSTLDLRNGFFHVPLETTSRKYTAFVTHNGQYEFLYAPFGISNSPAVFTRYINAVLGELIRSNTIIVYMDDIIIPSKSEKEGLASLKRVLDTAELYGLRIKWEKCQFLKKRVTFLGYVVEASTITPSREKTQAVNDFPIPTDKKMLQRFLGLTSYFRRFIPRYSLVAKPLTDLMGQYVEFRIADEQIAAFQQLKIALANPPLLRLFDPTLQTEVHTDASMFGYGGVLMQRDSEDRFLHPIEYMSRKTTIVEQKYHSYELEVLAIIAALKKWRVYVMGIKFKIVTDCNAFTLTMKKEDVPLRVSRWAMYLQDYQYDIEHRSGNQMRHVDALSRIHCLMMTDTLRHRIQQEQLKDDKLAAVRKILEHESYHDFYLKHGVLHKDLAKELMVVPTSMEQEVIQIAHRQGHYAAKKTQDLIERDFYIYDLAPKVMRVVKSCVECLVAEAKAGKKEGTLNPISK